MRFTSLAVRWSKLLPLGKYCRMRPLGAWRRRDPCSAVPISCDCGCGHRSEKPTHSAKEVASLLGAAERLLIGLNHLMSDSTSHALKRDIPRLTIVKAMAIIASIPSWLILRELSMGAPLPIAEIARRLHADSCSMCAMEGTERFLHDSKQHALA